MTVERILLIHVTWGFLLVNIIIAWVPQATLLLLFIRDLWMPMLFLILIFRRDLVPLLFLIFVGAIGAYQFDKLFSGNDVYSYFYGLRDISLVVLVAELAAGRINIARAGFNVTPFVYTVSTLAVCNIVFSNLLGWDIYENAFNLGEYYANKGVSVELGFGILGDRVGLPLYSPNLLCTMLVFYFFLDKGIALAGFQRIVAFVICIFTASKVLPLAIAYYLVGQRWVVGTLVGAIVFSASFLVAYQLAGEDTFISYHLASVAGHLESFSTTLESNIFSLRPSLLGSSSIAIANISPTSAVDAGLMESMLLARVSELKIWSVAFLAYFAYVFATISNDLGRKIFFIFIVTSLLTATSNHPVAWIPALLLVYQEPREPAPSGFFFWSKWLSGRKQGTA